METKSPAFFTSSQVGGSAGQQEKTDMLTDNYHYCCHVISIIWHKGEQDAAVKQTAA